MPYHITEKVFAKGGLNLTERYNFDRTKQIAFSDYQITKKSNMKSKLRLNESVCGFIDSTPPFANAMLAVVFYPLINPYPMPQVNPKALSFLM